MIKIFGYVRESTMQQAMFGYNIEEQKRVIEDYCKYHYSDYKLEVFEERGKSARSLNRPELKSLLETVKKAKADKVVFHSLDRLTRDIKDLYMLIEFFDKNKIELVSVMESLDLSTAIGRSHVFNSGVYAQLESERTSERTIRALKQAVLEGKYPFSTPPIGYERVDKRLVPTQDKEQLDLVQYIFSSVASNEYTLEDLQHEIRIRFGKKVSDNRLRKILKEKLYIGTMEYRGIVVENFCEGIVDPVIFNRASKNHAFRKQSKKNLVYVFKNIVRCTNCDVPMVQTSGTGYKNKRYTYYMCPVCGRRASQEKMIEKKNTQLQKITNLYFQDEEGYSEKKKEISHLRKRQRKLIEEQKKHELDEDIFYELYINLDDEINLLQKGIDGIKKNNKLFENLSPVFQKDIVHKYIQNVEIRFNNRTYGINIIQKDM